MSIAESLRRGLEVESVGIWFRDRQTSHFRVISAPATSAPPVLAESLQAIPDGGPGARLLLKHEEACIGLLEVRPEPVPESRDVLVVVADLLAGFLASLALSADFAIEVAAQSREIDEQRRFTSLIIDSLPVGLYVVDRDYRIQIWNRPREVGAPG
jgi:PAS domain-containing protein